MPAPGEKLSGPLFAAITALAPRLPPHGLALACWSASRLAVPPTVLQALASATLVAVRHDLEHPPNRSAKSENRTAAALDPRALAATAVSLSRSKALPPPLLAAMAQLLQPPQQLLEGAESPNLPSAVRSEVGVRVGASEAAQLVWAMAAASMPLSLRHSHPVLLRAFEGLSAAVARQAAGILPSSPPWPSPRGDAQYAAASAHAATPPVASEWRPSAEAPVERTLVPPLPGGQLCMFLTACARQGFHPGEAALQGVAWQLAPQLSSLSSHTLCELLAALATLGAGFSGITGSNSADGAIGAGQSPVGGIASGTCTQDAMIPFASEPSVGGPHPSPPSEGGPGVAPLPSEAEISAVAIVPRLQRSAGRARGSVGSLVRSAVALLTERLCTRQQELLTLGSAVQLAWALACLPRAMWWDERQARRQRPRPDPDSSGSEGEGGAEGAVIRGLPKGQRGGSKQAQRRKEYWRRRNAPTVSAPKLLTQVAAQVCVEGFFTALPRLFPAVPDC